MAELTSSHNPGFRSDIDFDLQKDLVRNDEINNTFHDNINSEHFNLFYNKNSEYLSLNPASKACYFKTLDPAASKLLKDKSVLSSSGSSFGRDLPNLTSELLTEAKSCPNRRFDGSIFEVGSCSDTIKTADRNIADFDRCIESFKRSKEENFKPP